MQAVTVVYDSKFLSGLHKAENVATALSQNTRSASFTTQKYINFSNKKIFLKKNLEI